MALRPARTSCQRFSLVRTHNAKAACTTVDSCVFTSSSAKLHVTTVFGDGLFKWFGGASMHTGGRGCSTMKTLMSQTGAASSKTPGETQLALPYQSRSWSRSNGWFRSVRAGRAGCCGKDISCPPAFTTTIKVTHSAHARTHTHTHTHVLQLRASALQD